MQNAHGDFHQLRIARLKQLFARECFENMLQRLAVVAVRREPGLRDGLIKLAPEKRDISWAGRIGHRREQTGDQALADHLALGVEFLDADGIEQNRAVNGGFYIGLGDDHRIGPAHQTLHSGGAALQMAQFVEHQPFRIAQYAEARAGIDARLGALAGAGKIIFPVAEKGEIIIMRPLQEILSLGDIGDRAFGIAQFKLVDNALHLGAHGLPILDRRVDVLENRFQVCLDFLDARRITLAVDGYAHHRFVLHAGAGLVAGKKIHELAGLVAPRPVYWMNDQMNRVAEAR